MGIDNKKRALFRLRIQLRECNQKRRQLSEIIKLIQQDEFDNAIEKLEDSQECGYIAVQEMEVLIECCLGAKWAN